jgi:hypothetical protein
VPRVITLRAPDFALDAAALRAAAASPRARVLVLNSPHNPTGHCVDEPERGRPTGGSSPPAVRSRPAPRLSH